MMNCVTLSTLPDETHQEVSGTICPSIKRSMSIYFICVSWWNRTHLCFTFYTRWNLSGLETSLDQRFAKILTMCLSWLTYRHVCCSNRVMRWSSLFSVQTSAISTITCRLAVETDAIPYVLKPATGDLTSWVAGDTISRLESSWDFSLQCSKTVLSRRKTSVWTGIYMVSVNSIPVSLI